MWAFFIRHIEHVYTWGPFMVWSKMDVVLWSVKWTIRYVPIVCLSWTLFLYLLHPVFLLKKNSFIKNVFTKGLKIAVFLRSSMFKAFLGTNSSSLQKCEWCVYGYHKGELSICWHIEMQTGSHVFGLLWASKGCRSTALFQKWLHLFIG